MKESREIIRPQVHDLDIDRSVEIPTVPAGSYPSYSAEARQGLQLLDYWKAIRKRLWLVLGIMVLFTTLASIYVARKPDVFRAKAVVQVDLEQTNPDVATIDRQRALPNADPAYINTQLQLLWSDSLLRRVIKDHNLDANKDLQKDRGEMATSSWRSALKSLGLATDPAANQQNAALEMPGELSIGSSEEIAEAVRLAPFVRLIHNNLEIDPRRLALNHRLR